MKKATCRDMRGASDAEFQGETAEEMGAKCREHVMEMMQSGDEDHKAAVENMMQLSKEEQEKWYDEFRNGFDSLQDA
jgi:arginyl-tRNA synthetase|tara:strand:+ start:738 stop:968 length:231 start_codon:yes stop_codon:yes gene_type:complete